MPRDARAKLQSVFAILFCAVAFLFFVTDGFGVKQPQPRKSLNDYSWAELSAIAAKISDAESDDAGLGIAREFNLCNEDGTLDPQNVKEFKLNDESSASVRIIGFRHDIRSDGQGRAGITFCFCEPIHEYCYNMYPPNKGGWADSALCKYMASSEYVSLMPADLRGGLKRVQKFSNNLGVANKLYAVNQTWMTFFPLSKVEYCGPSLTNDSDENLILAAQGDQYQLFRETQVSLASGKLCWTRSISSTQDLLAWAINETGEAVLEDQTSELSLTPAFCY